MFVDLNICSTRNKQGELEALDLSQSYGIIGIREIGWDKSHDRSAITGRSCLGHGDHEIVEFKNFGVRRQGLSCHSVAGF